MATKFICQKRGFGRRKVSTSSVARHESGTPSVARPHFVRCCRGTVTVEGAVALSVLVAALAGLLAIVEETYAKDRLARGARAAARAIAIDASSDACVAIRRELGLDEDFNCSAQWEIAVDRGSPSTLLALVQSETTVGASSGEMVLVRIGIVRASSSTDGEGEGTQTGQETGESVSAVAMGIARGEEESV